MKYLRSDNAALSCEFTTPIRKKPGQFEFCGLLLKKIINKLF